MEMEATTHMCSLINIHVRKLGRAQLSALFPRSTISPPPHYVSTHLCCQVPVSTTADVATGTRATDRSTVDSSRAICLHALTPDHFIRLGSPLTLRVRPGCHSHMHKCEQVMPKLIWAVRDCTASDGSPCERILEYRWGGSVAFQDRFSISPEVNRWIVAFVTLYDSS